MVLARQCCRQVAYQLVLHDKIIEKTRESLDFAPFPGSKHGASVPEWTKRDSRFQNLVEKTTVFCIRGYLQETPRNELLAPFSPR
jgi:hypothetical protein